MEKNLSELGQKIRIWRGTFKAASKTIQQFSCRICYFSYTFLNIWEIFTWQALLNIEKKGRQNRFGCKRSENGSLIVKMNLCLVNNGNWDFGSSANSYPSVRAIITLGRFQLSTNVYFSIERSQLSQGWLQTSFFAIIQLIQLNGSRNQKPMFLMARENLDWELTRRGKSAYFSSKKGLYHLNCEKFFHQLKMYQPQGLKLPLMTIDPT